MRRFLPAFPPSVFQNMKRPEEDFIRERDQSRFGYDYFVLTAVSLLSIVATFFIADSNLDFEAKRVVFVAIILIYPALIFAGFLWRKNKLAGRNAKFETEASENLFNFEVENRLQALEEASEFFGASLKSADMFRLCASRINELIPFAVCALFLANEDNTRLRISLAVGEKAEQLKNLETESHKGIAGKAFVSRRVEADENLFFEKNAFSPDVLKNLKSAVAVPLARGADIFGVLALYGDAERAFDDKSLKLAEAVGERIAPLFLSSFAFEQNVANALTDALTNLPNERAFYLVLENQIAESHRFREERPLTVLTVDIKNFAELNEKFGHAAGDRILTFAADLIKEQLRGMDFLARAAGDEFLAVLPTANDDTAAEIVGRIERAFAQKAFEISRLEKHFLQLNFGTATFWKDGETAGKLLQTAHLKKQQAKSPVKSSVLWFPKEYVN